MFLSEDIQDFCAVVPEGSALNVSVNEVLHVGLATNAEPIGFASDTDGEEDQTSTSAFKLKSYQNAAAVFCEEVQRLSRIFHPFIDVSVHMTLARLVGSEMHQAEAFLRRNSHQSSISQFFPATGPS